MTNSVVFTEPQELEKGFEMYSCACLAADRPGKAALPACGKG